MTTEPKQDEPESDGEAKPIGRPSAFSESLADVICERLADGQSLRSICRDEAMPSQSMVFRWLAANEGFREQYARAREAQADVLFDEILHIADTPLEGVKTKTVEDEDGTRSETMVGDMIEHRRLQVDARKWMLGKMQPKKYGDRQQMELSGPGGGDIGIRVVERRIVRPGDPGTV